MTNTRRLLARLRELRAHGSAPLSALLRLVGSELVSEVCSVYVQRPGDILELTATEGLNPEAVGLTRLRVGEGIIGLCAATGKVMNLPDAQNHPAFAYRPETNEEPFASMLAVPVRRSGRILGVLAVQNRTPRQYTRDEIDDLETVAMLLAEMLPGSGAMDGAPEGIGATLRRAFAVLKFLAQTSPLSSRLIDIASATGIPPSTIHRLLGAQGRRSVGARGTRFADAERELQLRRGSLEAVARDATALEDD